MGDAVMERMTVQHAQTILERDRALQEIQMLNALLEEYKKRFGDLKPPQKKPEKAPVTPEHPAIKRKRKKK